MGKSTISMAIFNSFLLVYQRVWFPGIFQSQDPTISRGSPTQGCRRREDLGQATPKSLLPLSKRRVILLVRLKEPVRKVPAGILSSEKNKYMS
jgi:hypothetical protein